MGRVPSWTIAPPCSMGAWSKSGQDGDIAKDYKESNKRRCIQNPGIRAAEAEGGEGQASRMGHTLPQAVIHVDMFYAVVLVRLSTKVRG